MRREYDHKKYWHKIIPESTKHTQIMDKTSVTYGSKQTTIEHNDAKITHEEIQWTLLKLGSDLGLHMWVANNDRNKQFARNQFQDIPGLLSSLPIQVNERFTKVIERIDVLWLKEDMVISAFEIEHTTQIYSGLLRMSDLVTLVPAININLFIVAPDERRNDVMGEIQRPTFSRGLKQPLSTICRFIPYSALKNEIKAYGPRIKRVPPDFLDDIAESF